MAKIFIYSSTHSPQKHQFWVLLTLNYQETSSFLLTAGIFIGAVWAKQSWGRYWGWDPKETCALITMIIYAIPMHRCIYKSKKKDSGKYMVYNIFANHNILNIYLFCAILSVIFTYFGANYIFPGLHSYAWCIWRRFENIVTSRTYPHWGCWKYRKFSMSETIKN